MTLGFAAVHPIDEHLRHITRSAFRESIKSKQTAVLVRIPWKIS